MPIKPTLLTLSLIFIVSMGMAQSKKVKADTSYYMISAISQTGKTGIGIYKLTWEPNVNDCKLIMGKQLRLDSSVINVLAVYKTTKNMYVHFQDKSTVTFKQ